jgi:hypothetical protein
MEKNIPALLDKAARSIHVQYQHADTPSYTYISNIEGLVEGDYVVVPTSVRDKIVSGNAGSVRVFEPGEYGTEGLISTRLRQEAERMLTGQRLTIGRVVKIDEIVDIEPNDTIEYKWVIAKVDLSAYSSLMDRNKEIADAVRDAYKQNLRKSFSERILGELSEDSRNSLLRLIG